MYPILFLTLSTLFALRTFSLIPFWSYFSLWAHGVVYISKVFFYSFLFLSVCIVFVVSYKFFFKFIFSLAIRCRSVRIRVVSAYFMSLGLPLPMWWVYECVCMRLNGSCVCMFETCALVHSDSISKNHRHRSRHTNDSVTTWRSNYKHGPLRSTNSRTNQILNSRISCDRNLENKILSDFETKVLQRFEQSFFHSTTCIQLGFNSEQWNTFRVFNSIERTIYFFWRFFSKLQTTKYQRIFRFFIGKTLNICLYGKYTIFFNRKISIFSHIFCGSRF